MKYITPHQLSRIEQGLLAISLTLLGGCAEWSSNPARTQADYGASVRNMVSKQIYSEDKAQHPADEAPDGMEGNKANSVLEGTYRGLIVKPDQRLSQPSVYGVDGRGTGISTSGGSAR